MLSKKEKIKLLANTVRADINNYKKNNIFELPQNKEYIEKLNLPITTFNNYLKEALTEEERRYRKSEIQSKIGQKSKGNKNFGAGTKEDKQIINLKAKLAEEMTKRINACSGWKAVKIREHSFDNNGVFTGMKLKEKEIKELKNGKKILRDLEKARREINNFKYPDLVMENKKRVKFVEVKSSDINLTSFRQKRSLEALGRLGYESEVTIFPITIEDLVSDYERVYNRECDKKELVRLLKEIVNQVTLP